jgi:hypothetical protein
MLGISGNLHHISDGAQEESGLVSAAYKVKQAKDEYAAIYLHFVLPRVL